MMSMESNEANNSTDVLIVGAGPSGLMMACQLALHGISFRLIDKKAGPANYSGALIVHARSLELFQQLGIANSAIENGIIAREIKMVFNGKKSFVIPVGNLGYNLTPFPYMLLLEQSKTEALLIEFLQKRGFQIERETELLEIRQNSDKVISVLKSGNGEETVQSKYLIGADGAHSIARKQLAIPFPGNSHHIPLFVSDCEAKTDFPNDQIQFSFTNAATTGFFPLSGNRWRIDGTVSGKQRVQPTFEDVKRNFQEKTSTAVQLKKAEWFSVFETSSRIAERYRENRCFLVGDAAHIHSPVGAQGMNTGLQDATNLAWKLASVIHGKADEKLLETYEQERKNIAQNIIRQTDWVFDFVTSRHVLIRYFRVHLTPVFLKLFYPILTGNGKLRRSFFRKLSGIAIHYRESALSKKASSGKFPSHAPKPGDRLPFLNYSNSGEIVNIQEKISVSKFLLLIFSDGIVPEEIIRLRRKYADRVTIEVISHSPENQNFFRQFEIRNFGFYLIRPDGYIALRSTKLEINQLEDYFEKLKFPK